MAAFVPHLRFPPEISGGSANFIHLFTHLLLFIHIVIYLFNHLSIHVFIERRDYYLKILFSVPLHVLPSILSGDLVNE